MTDIKKYQEKDFYPSTSIRDVVESKYPSLKIMSYQTDRITIKQMIHIVIEQYKDDVLLPLTATHTKMVVEWITSEYDPISKLGGALGYSIEDIHLVFRMGLRGDFGKPVGHKFILTDITAEGGWFDQYQQLRTNDHSEYHEQRNRELMNMVDRISETAIPCPEEYKTDLSGIMRSNKMKSVYNSPKLKPISKKQSNEIVNNIIKNDK